jgi:cell division septum initiation protein DivIVA
MQPEVLNLYINRLVKEIEDLNKNRFLIEVQLQYAESMNDSLNKRIIELTNQLEKINKKKTKEVNTSSDDF